MRHALTLSGILVTLWAAGAAEPGAAPQTVRLPVTRDARFSDVGDEARCNAGGTSRLKLKSFEEMSLIDVDPAALRGHVIRAATLHLRSAGEPRLARVTVSGVGADWVEGTAESEQPQRGSSCFLARQFPDVPWAYPGSDLCSVILGQGGTSWRMADALTPDTHAWQRVAVDPSVVAARVAGLSHGFLLFDDTGTEWTRQGEAFALHLFPNRFVYSRECGAESAPYLAVTLGERDDQPPGPPEGLRGDAADLPAGEAWLSWTTPADAGPAGTLGFFVTVDGRDVPRYLIPLAGRPGERVRMHLRDLGQAARAQIEVRVRAVDGAGNVGEPAAATVTVSGAIAPPLPGTSGRPFTRTAPLPKLAGAEVAVVDELDKVHPVSGAMIPEQPAEYLAANHLWSAAAKEVELYAARNEFVAFQVLVRGTVDGLRPELTFAGPAQDVQAAFGRYVHVSVQGGPLPDPVVPLDGGFTVPDPPQRIAGQTSGSLHAELYVPHDAPAGAREGTLMLRAGEETLALKVKLHVWDFTLPDFLSFLPEMNCYGLPQNERAFYRLAHRHRTVLNRVPYSQAGSILDNCAPGWNGGEVDFPAWDGRFGPYFDGSAFADLPRKGVPLECFYLPLHENWPTLMEGSYNGDYWADRSFPAKYREDFVAVSRRFAEHAEGQGWHDTFFQCFLNNKVDYKEHGWSHASSPWALDEPANFQDYWALRWFAAAFHDGVRQAGGRAKMVFRADVSRPQWQRDALDGLLDYAVVGGTLRRYRRIVMDRKEATGQVVLEYGGSNPITGSNVQPLAWCLDAWALGCDGVEPWLAVGSTKSWRHADDTALFYPVPGDGDPVPSVRLKAYRRGQQDVEYLTLLAQVLRRPRWAVAERVREALHVAGKHTASGAADAGHVRYDRLRPQDVWRLRVQVGSALSEAHPKPRRRLVELRTPPRDPSRLAPRYVSGGEAPRSGGRDAPAARIGRILQGRAVVRDALIDPDQADRNFGAEPRANALRTAGRGNAFLVRFDLSRLGLPPGATVERTTLSFYVWDPSSQGKSKVCAYPLKTGWDEATATWQQPAEGGRWRGGEAFDLAKDTGEASAPVIVRPDVDSDTVDPPLEYRLDVTAMVRAWLAGEAPNEGLAIVPIADRTVDEGFHTRFQIYGSEYRRPQYTPRLTIDARP
jgi:hypothetical protein